MPTIIDWCRPWGKAPIYLLTTMSFFVHRF